jgi:hypothetical protein
MAAALRPIHERVAVLQAQGLTGEQAWAEVLKDCAPVGGKGA